MFWKCGTSFFGGLLNYNYFMITNRPFEDYSFPSWFLICILCLLPTLVSICSVWNDDNFFKLKIIFQSAHRSFILCSYRDSTIHFYYTYVYLVYLYRHGRATAVTTFFCEQHPRLLLICILARSYGSFKCITPVPFNTRQIFPILEKYLLWTGGTSIDGFIDFVKLILWWELHFLSTLGFKL